MALQTDLNVSPYFDDFSESKDYYRVLFKPGVAVQARELNQLQAMLQNQIEKFGDNVFKRGTIIEGCTVQKHDRVPFVKIKDLDTSGIEVSVSSYQNLYVKNSSNVQAFIAKTATGFESQSPNLNTLFVNYTSSGTDSNTTTFAADDNLTVFDRKNPIFSVAVNDGSSAFANGDTTVFLSAIAIQYANGSAVAAADFPAGEVITNGVANAVIIEANTTANTEALVLKIRPEYADLVSANTVKWRFAATETIQTGGNTATIAAVIGSGATGSLVTDSVGKIASISVVSQGSGYYVPPHVTVANNTATSTFGATELGDLDLVAKNFLATVTVANSALTPIGTGYGITVGDGVVYQKGFFSRVARQFEIVNKYSNTSFDKSVGFFTEEDIVDSNEDTTLLDNATGTYNFSAPGADRMKLTPRLTVLDKTEADANTEFLPIAEFADGRLYQTKADTQYNVINQQIAQRTFEESGNYTIDQFLTKTKDSSLIANTANSFSVVVDPGKAYINGYKIQTIDNFTTSVDKGTDTIADTSAKVKLGLGSFINVDELGGVWDFDLGVQVDLYDTAANYLTGGGGTISAAGTKIGIARIRSVVYDSGNIGSSTGKYRMYMFDIKMDQGAAFADVKSVHYSAGDGAIADVVLESSKAVLQDPNDSALLYKIAPAVATCDTINYIYRTVDETEQANSTGYIVLNLGANKFFNYTTELNTSEKRELLVVPTGDFTSQTNATGTVEIFSNTTITGTSTLFDTEFAQGDWVIVANSTGGSTTSSQIASINSNTSITLTSALSQTYSSGKIKLYFPKNVPVSLTNKSNKWANVDSSNSQVLTVFLGNTVANLSSGAAAAMPVSVTYNAIQNNVSSAAKTSKRDSYVRIVVSNNASSGVRGPWPLGVADAYRLKSVHVANTASRTLTVNAAADVDAAGDFISVSNNVFANGDSFVYEGTQISGLSNGTYFAVFANSSGFAVATSFGGANVDIGTGSAGAETFTGQPIHFTESTFGVTDVTNEYLIDTGQKEDMLDISHLVRKPRNTTLSTNDTLLVKFDSFHNAQGVKSIGSYSINDSANLTTLSSGSDIHTLEIPEMINKQGRYFDLRENIDFRPVAANTIAHNTDASNNSIINPGLPSNTNYFAATSTYFPAPDTTLTANITYYVGRVDRVVLDSKGDIVVRSGEAGVNPKVPPASTNALDLQVYKIPPYPSLPESLSNDIVKIADTKLSSDAAGVRKNKSKVLPLLNKDEIDALQQRRYTMKDIGSLENRIDSLEYYVSYTLAEVIANQRFIPSSVDAAVERFKFGFFVDPFTDYTFSDLTNGEYYSTIRDGRLGPHEDEINISFEPSDVDAAALSLPYNEFTIVNQDVATSTASPTDPNDTVTQVTRNIIQEQRTSAYDRSGTGQVFEDFFYTFSATNGQAEMYFVSRDNEMAVAVYQSSSATGPWTLTHTSETAGVINQSDITNKGLRTSNGNWVLNRGFDPSSGQGRRGAQIEGYKSRSTPLYKSRDSGDGGRYIEDQFKLLWTHNATSGQYVRIRVFKGKKDGNDGSAGSFGYKLYYPADDVAAVVTPSPLAVFDYVGIVNAVSPSEFAVRNVTVTQGEIRGSNYISDSQAFIIAIRGLRPNTDHTFTFDGADKTSKCVQIRSSLNQSATTGLRSDPSGILVFTYYYDAGLDEARSDVERTNQIIAQIAGQKSFKVENTDGSSKAEGTIKMHYYTDSSEPAVNPLTPTGSTPTDVFDEDLRGSPRSGGASTILGSGDLTAPPIGDQYWVEEVQTVGPTLPRAGVNIRRF